MEKIFLGIDFGTCNIKVACYGSDQRGILKLHKHADKGDELPNVISFRSKTKCNISAIGYEAISWESQKRIKSDTIRYIKTKLQAYNWSTRIYTWGRMLNAQEVTAEILSKINAIINDKISNKGREQLSVITVPVCFSEVQKNMVKQAAMKAGINVNKILTEPFAALLSNNQLLQTNGLRFILVFDFGGSTLDISVVKVSREDDELEIEELTTAGIRFGGIDIDDALYEYLFKSKYANESDLIKNNDTDGFTESRLKNFVVELKENLFLKNAEVTEFFIDDANKEYEFSITVEEAEQVFFRKGYKKKIISLLDEMFDESDDVSKEDITIVQPVGGTSRIKYFMDILEEYFNNKVVFDSSKHLSNKISEQIYNSVACGAVNYLRLISDDDLDVTVRHCLPFSIGVDKKGVFEPIIKKNSYEVRGNITIKPKDLSENKFRLKFYQIFSNISEEIAITEENGAVYMGQVSVNPDDIDLFGESIIVELTLKRNGEMEVSFFKRIKVDEDEWDLVQFDEKILRIGE